jgi:hypothetical protein
MENFIPKGVIKSVYPLTINLINQRFIVWKLNNTNVDWKNTATVLNCVSARWQDEEDRPPISIFWASPCFAGDSESYNPLWNLERSTGHVPHTIANIYYPELSGYFKESKPSSESVPIQEPTPLVCKEGPRLRSHLALTQFNTVAVFFQSTLALFNFQIMNL